MNGLRRLRERIALPHLVETHDPNRVKASYSAINSFVSVAVMALVAHLTSEPFLFPSLGPTAFLLFYLSCIAITWWIYTRRGGLLFDVERGGGPQAPSSAPTPAQ